MGFCVKHAVFMLQANVVLRFAKGKESRVKARWIPVNAAEADCNLTFETIEQTKR